MRQRDTAHLVDILTEARFFKIHYDERRRLLVTVHLPEELVHLLEPASIEQEVLEGLLLKLVAEGRVSLGKATELLAMDRLEAIR